MFFLDFPLYRTYLDVADPHAVFHARYGNIPTNFQLTGRQISPEDNFRVADHPEVIAWWLEAKWRVRPLLRAARLGIGKGLCT